MSGDVVRAGTVEAAAAREALVESLRRRGGHATAGDLAADTGLPLEEVDVRLRDLVHDYESHLDVDEAGTLVYRFAAELRERLRPESPSERRARRRLALLRGLRRTVRGVTLAGAAVYGWLYGAIAIAAFLSMGLLGGKVWLTDAVIAWRNRFRQARGEPLLRTPAARPWDEGARATPVAEPLLPRLKAASERVVRFVAGPARPADDVASRERRVVAWLRTNRGVVVPAEVVRLLGVSLDEADRLLTRLLVAHRGDVEVDDDGTLRYRFDALATSAASAPAGEGEGDGDALAPVWRRPSPREDRLVRDRKDLWIPALGAVNVATALALDRWALPRLGWDAFWVDALLVWFPIGWTGLLGGAAIVRWLAARRRRAAREGSWTRSALLRVILGGGETAPRGRALPLDAAALRRLVPPPVPSDAVLEASANALVLDLHGDIGVDEGAPPGGEGSAAAGPGAATPGDDPRVVARFPRVRAELAAATAARAALHAGHARLGRIVWSTRDAL